MQLEKTCRNPRPTVLSNHSGDKAGSIAGATLREHLLRSFLTFSPADPTMDILLTHGYFLYEDPKELQIMKPYPPLGILYICSHLREKGLKAEVFDSTFSSRQELWDVLRKGPPSILGVYANLMTRSNVVEILRVAKAAGWQTLVGGPEPGAYVDEYLAAGADVVVIGEGEITLEELVPALRSHAVDNLSHIDGIAFRAPDGSVVRTKPREQIKDIDAQPWPARECIDMSRYVDVWREHHGMGSVSIITARGCPYHCRWCSHEVFGKTHRRRKPASVADELEWLVNRYHPQMAWMADDVFTIHHGWLFQYAAELKRRGLKLPFECISRADRLNLEVVKTLAEIGCFRVWIGSESGSQRILDAMERGVTVEASANGSRTVPIGRNSNWHVPDVGIRRRRSLRHRGHGRTREEDGSRYFLHHRRVSHQGHALFF